MTMLLRCCGILLLAIVSLTSAAAQSTAGESADAAFGVLPYVCCD